MGIISTRFFKPFKNWNVENRAHKVISREKPKPAPTYKSTEKQIMLVNQLEPHYAEKALKKDQLLNDYLKKVYVTSNSADVDEIDSRSDPNRPLPKDKLLHEGFQYGHYEPKTIRPGRVSLRQALDFLSNHKKEPEKYTIEYIATEYKLDKKVVEDILMYYSLFNIHHSVENYNQDLVISTMPISHRTGVQVCWSDDGEEGKIATELKRLRKTFQGSFDNSLPIEEEKKKRLS